MFNNLLTYADLEKFISSLTPEQKLEPVVINDSIDETWSSPESFTFTNRDDIKDNEMVDEVGYPIIRV